MRLAAFASEAHFFEQYFTFSQSRSHFFLQAISRLQWAQGLVGRWWLGTNMSFGGEQTSVWQWYHAAQWCVLLLIL